MFGFAAWGGSDDVCLAEKLGCARNEDHCNYCGEAHVELGLRVRYELVEDRSEREPQGDLDAVLQGKRGRGERGEEESRSKYQ